MDEEHYHNDDNVELFLRVLRDISPNTYRLGEQCLGFSRQDVEIIYQHGLENEWTKLCNCLLAALAVNQSEITLDDYISQENAERLSVPVIGMNLVFSDSRREIPTMNKDMTFLDLLLACRLYDISTDYSFKDSTPVYRLVEELHSLRRVVLDEKIQRVFQPMYSPFISNTPYLHIDTGEPGNHIPGILEEQLAPLIACTLRKMVNTHQIPSQGWAVIFDMGVTRLSTDLSITSERNSAIGKAYNKIDPDIHSVFLVFMVEIPLHAHMPGTVESLVRPLVILVLRDRGRVSISILDRYWSTNDNPHMISVCVRYINFIGQLANSMLLSSYVIMLPMSFKSFWKTHIVEKLNRFTFGPYQEWSNRFEKGEEFIDIWFGYNSELGEFNMSSSMRYLLDELPLYSEVLVSEESVQKQESKRAMKTLPWFEVVYDPVLYISFYIHGMKRWPHDASEDLAAASRHLQEFTADLVDAIRASITKINVHLLACILAGAYLIPPCVIHGVRQPSEKFYFIDGKDSFPSDVYTFCITRDSVYALIMQEDHAAASSSLSVVLVPDTPSMATRPLPFLTRLEKLSSDSKPHNDSAVITRPERDWASLVLNPHCMEIVKNAPPMPFNINPPFSRVLTADAKEMTYSATNDKIRTRVHWGRRKLVMHEIEFLTLIGESDLKGALIVYAGAAPGIHIPVLCEMFRGPSFLLIDPMDFKVEESHRIQIIKDFFDDKLARQIASKNKHRSIYFISDVRKQGKDSKNRDVTEDEIKAEQQQQMQWHFLVNSKRSILKFRLPWDQGTTEYLDGDVYLPVYGPQATTESRLITRKGHPGQTRMYDNQKYERQLMFFNNVTRHSLFPHDVKGEGIDHCYDCTAEIHILKEYLKAYPGRILESGKIPETVSLLSKDISRKIDKNGRTLANSTPYWDDKPSHGNPHKPLPPDTYVRHTRKK